MHRDFTLLLRKHRSTETPKHLPHRLTEAPFFSYRSTETPLPTPMNSHSIPILAFSICCTLALGLLEPAAAEPTLQFRWLQTDSKWASDPVFSTCFCTLILEVYYRFLSTDSRSDKHPAK